MRTEPAEMCAEDREWLNRIGVPVETVVGEAGPEVFVSLAFSGSLLEDPDAALGGAVDGSIPDGQESDSAPRTDT